MDVSDFITAFSVFILCWNNCGCEPSGQKFGHSGTILNAEVVQGFPPTKEFFTHFVLPSKPLIMKGAAKLSPAFSKWDDSYFLSREEASQAIVVVENRKKENRTYPVTESSFKEFVEMYEGSDKYMVNSVPGFLRNEVLLPGPLQCREISEKLLVADYMWFSSGGTKSVVHTDPVDNILCLFRGEKSFIMVDPAKYSDKVDIDRMEGSYSDIDIDSVDYEKYPGLVGIEFYHMNISAGDCLFIPYKWIHQVESHNRNIAVNVWWDYYKNREVDIAACEANVDPSITIDQAVFIGFKDFQTVLTDNRDNLYEWSYRTKNFTIDKYVELLHQKHDLSQAGDGYKAPIKQIFHIVDVNRDGKIQRNELLSVTNENWEVIMEHIKRSEDIVAAITDGMDKEENEERDEL